MLGRPPRRPLGPTGQEHAGAKVYFVIFLTGALGLRCGEALALRREDINLEAAIPKVIVSRAHQGGKKSPGDVYVRRQHLKLLRTFLRDGIRSVRRRGHKHGRGRAKTIELHETYSPPKSGFLFPSRSKAKRPYLHYHAVYDHVRRQAPKFLAHLQRHGKQWDAAVAKLRPHSGRATLITELMGEGLTTALSMKYARHAPGSHKIHLRYGHLRLHDVKQACDATRGSNPRLAKRPWATMSTRDLLKTQWQITEELGRRDALK